MRKYFKYVLSFPLALSAHLASAANLQNAFDLSSVAAKKANYSTNTDTGYANLEGLLSIIIMYVLSILGVVFVALIIYGGITWMTANGNEQKVNKAEEIIKQALIGLVIVIAAYVISYFLINVFGGQLTK